MVATSLFIKVTSNFVCEMNIDIEYWIQSLEQ